MVVGVAVLEGVTDGVMVGVPVGVEEGVAPTDKDADAVADDEGVSVLVGVAVLEDDVLGAMLAAANSARLYGGSATPRKAVPACDVATMLFVAVAVDQRHRVFADVAYNTQDPPSSRPVMTRMGAFCRNTGTSATHEELTRL